MEFNKPPKTFVPFDEISEIESNRNNKITVAQIQRLSIAQFWVRYLAGWVVIVVLLILVIGLLSPSTIFSIPVWFWMVSCSIVGVYFYWIYKRAKIISVDIVSGKVQNSLGTLTESYTIELPNSTLKTVDDFLLKALMPGQYRFYYLPLSKQLLSAENIEKEQVLSLPPGNSNG